MILAPHPLIQKQLIYRVTIGTGPTRMVARTTISFRKPDTVLTLLIVRILIVMRPKSLLVEKRIVHPLIIVQSLIVVILYNLLINYIIKLERLFSGL